MPSSHTSRLLCLSIISGALAGCGGDDCGTKGAPDNGITAGDGAGIALVFGGLTASANNDCPPAGSGVTSVTIEGHPTSGSGFFTLCVPHPDRLATSQDLGQDVPGAETIHVVDVSCIAPPCGTGSGSACTYDVDHSKAPTGTAHAEGVCGNGTDPHGFALDIDGTVDLLRCCGGGTPGACTGTQDSVNVMLTGRTRVMP
jgi:hypothetical protein